MSEKVNKMDELKEFHMSFDGEYDIVGMKVRTKPMKLQLQKETFGFIAKLMAHVREVTGISPGAEKDAGEQFLTGMAILGFLTNDDNLAECLAVFTKGDTDWKEFIEANEDCYDMILDSAVTILSNFFLGSMKFIVKRISF